MTLREDGYSRHGRAIIIIFTRITFAPLVGPCRSTVRGRILKRLLFLVDALKLFAWHALKGKIYDYVCILFFSPATFTDVHSGDDKTLVVRMGGNGVWTAVPEKKAWNWFRSTATRFPVETRPNLQLFESIDQHLSMDSRVPFCSLYLHDSSIIQTVGYRSTRVQNPNFDEKFRVKIEDKITVTESSNRRIKFSSNFF